MKIFKFTAFTIAAILYAMSASAVPMSFTKNGSGNMHDVNWVMLHSGNIQVYTDEESTDMGRYALNSIRDAYPYLSLLLGVKVGEQYINREFYKNFLVSEYPKIVLILGDRMEGAGFANPITQNIEAQMIHPRSAAFFQHELVHRLMYEHNDFHIGSMGRLFSLAMMPTWWIEGLAESLTESAGRLEIQGFLRNMASQDHWPTWERLHSLYHADGDENLRGYIVAGRFLRWILTRSNEKDLYDVQEQIANETVRPFFYNASDRWLKKHFKKTGKELYEDFKKQQKKSWDSYLDNIPKLTSSQIDETVFSEKTPYNIYTNYIKTVLSKMNANTNYKESALLMSSNEEVVRQPISLQGSSIFAVDSRTYRSLLTVKRNIYMNSSFGDELKLVDFKDSVFSLKDENTLRVETIPFASEKKPFVVQEIRSVGDGGYFIHASLKGNSFIYYFNSKKNLLKKIVELKFPITPKLLEFKNSKYLNNIEQRSCVYAILNWDKEKTSLNKFCASGPQIEIIPPKKLFMQDGIVLKPNTFRLIVGWDKVLALVDATEKSITPLAAFPEWVEGLYSFSPANDILATWVYEKSQYKLIKFDLEKLKTNFAKWRNKLYDSSAFSEFIPWQPYEPPYKKMALKFLANNNPKLDLSKEKDPIKFKTEPNTKIKNPAPLEHNVLFVFPYALPTALGGPTVNLVTMPYVDKMERDAIQVFAGYHFNLKAPNATVTYINNRLFDGFAVSLFTTPYFNGIYKNIDHTGEVKTYYNYLNQEGISQASSFRFKPYSLKLDQFVTLSHLKPYTALEAPPSWIGAQNINLLSLTENLYYNLFQTNIYLGDKQKPRGHYLYWKTDTEFGVGKFNSLGDTKDYDNKSSGYLDYYNVNASLTSTFRYNKQTFTLSGHISTTQGKNSLNLKEFDSPYESYILGSSKSLSYASYPIIANDALFQIKMGYWSQQMAAQYDFPILKDSETLFLMSYINDWHAYVTFQDDGVSIYKNGSKFHNTDSVTVGTHFNMDIKGVTFEPSLSYTQLLTQSGWGVIMQIKFMDLFRY
jgi:hypothetical protein